MAGLVTMRNRFISFCCIAFLLTGIFALRTAAAAPDMLTAIGDLERQWATISYHRPRPEQEAAFPALLQQAEAIIRQYPGQALPLAWRGIILCSYAEVRGGLQALDNVTEARDLFLKAKEIDPHVMNGTVDGYLGTLYYEVPAWPIGFGDKRKAQQYFQTAVAENPTGIDTHFLYGHYLFEIGDKVAARQHLKAGLAVPIRPDHADYDAGRRQDIEETLAKMK